MRSGCLKFFLIVCLFGVGAVTVLIYKAGSILEYSVNQIVADRGGSIEVREIGYDFDAGLLLHVSAYQEADLQVRDVTISAPLLSVFQYKDGLPLKLHAEEISLMLPPRTETLSQPVGEGLREAPSRIAALCEVLLQRLKGSPLRSIEASVTVMEVKIEDQQFIASVTLDGELDASKLLVLTARAEGERLGGMFTIEIDPVGASVAIDFSGSARDWSGLLDNELQALNAILLNYSFEVDADPLESGAFLETSGYFRWNASAPDTFNCALLGNLGAIEGFVDGSKVSMQPTSFGLATDGTSVFRAYLKAPIDNMLVGVDTFDSGELFVHIENQSLQVVMSLGNDRLELISRGYTSFFEGFGQLNVSLNTDKIRPSLLQSFYVDFVPLDLNFKAKLQLDSQLDMLAWELVSVDAASEWSLSELELPSSSLRIDDISGKSKFSFVQSKGGSGSAVIEADAVDLAGIEISKFRVAAKADSLDTIKFSDFGFRLFDGEVSGESFSWTREKDKQALVNLKLSQIQLDQLVAAVPQFEGELSGSASGNLILGIGKSGLLVGGGELSLDRSSSARLSYSLNGLLTKGLEEGTPAYEQYQLAERALEDLKLQRFQIKFFPEDKASNPIILAFYGESKQENMTVPVDYTLNVNTNDSAGLIQLLQRMQRGELEIN